MRTYTYEEAAAEILAAPRFKVIPSVENVRQYLEYFGHPENSFKVIHVAGTNGKGSTCSFLESILRKQGIRTGLFTSPHLVSMRERMQINREMVKKALFVKAFETVKKAQAVSGYPPLTFFELVLVMAVLIFQEEKVEYAVMETGMGGRYDATNALNPKICIITAIGLDHMQYLGNTIEEIAREKAGIMKPGVPCVYVDREKTITDLMREEAEKNMAKLCLISEDSIKLNSKRRKVIDFSIENRYYINSSLRVKSEGLYQAENGAVAAVAAKLLFPDLPDSVMEEGLFDAFWPGRMEEIRENVMIDGAHNEPSIKAFMNSVRNDGKSCQERILVFAVAADKDYDAMAEELLRDNPFSRVILTRIPYERMEDPAVIRPVFEKYTDVLIDTEEEMEKAVEKAFSIQKKEKNVTVYMAGSLYFIGSLKEYLASRSAGDGKEVIS